MAPHFRGADPTRPQKDAYPMNDGTYAKASQMATAGAARLASASGHAAAGTWLLGTTAFGCATNPNPASRVSIDRNKHRSRRIQGSWP